MGNSMFFYTDRIVSWMHNFSPVRAEKMNSEVDCAGNDVIVRLLLIPWFFPGKCHRTTYHEGVSSCFGDIAVLTEQSEQTARSGRFVACLCADIFIEELCHE